MFKFVFFFVTNAYCLVNIFLVKEKNIRNSKKVHVQKL